MKQLAWKEFRENLWMLLVTVLLPPGWFILVRAIAGSRQPWNQGGWGGFIMIEFVIFGAWGAMRMSPERAAGWLTLRMLPVRVWQVWLLKLVAGLGWAIACSVYVGLVGRTILPGPSASPAIDWQAVWMLGACLSLFYTIGFAASLFLNATASRMVGVLGGLLGLFALDALMSQSSHAHLVIVYSVYWIPSAALGVLALWAMAAQARGASLRRTGAVLVAAFAVVMAVLIVPRIPHLGQTRAQFYGYVGLSLVPCPGTAQYADTELINADVIRDKETTGSITGMRLWARSADGKSKRLVASGDKRLTPMTWTSDCQLIYLSEAFRAARARLMRWDPRTGKSSLVAEMDPIPNDLWFLLAQTGIAAEPGGDRIAFARVTSGRFGFGRCLDLWVTNLRTGEGRLLWPNISGREVMWRAGRIYLRSSRDLVAISPEGGRLRQAHFLPLASRGEAR